MNENANVPPLPQMEEEDENIENIEPVDKKAKVDDDLNFDDLICLGAEQGPGLSSKAIAKTEFDRYLHFPANVPEMKHRSFSLLKS